jgi:4-amino-4-deoxy-L-arabinose transferase-like glycosyltransferase
MSKKHSKQAKLQPRLETKAPPKSGGLARVEWLRKHSLLAFILLVAAASLRIVTTYEVFNHTIDEPAHIACGMQWLAEGTYRYEPQHPPLARVAAALGPYLEGIRSYDRPGIYQEGAAILYRNGHYDRNLDLARLGILPFFWIASLAVYVWARKCGGEPYAALAVLMFTFLPPVLAHAGLATTDMALTAFTGCAFLAALFWLDQPALPRSALFGACTGLAVLSKFSALAFLPAAMVAALIWYLAVERPGFSGVLAAARKCALPFCAAVLIGFLVIWAGYRFSFGKVSFASLPLPAPELFKGIQQVLEHNSKGNPAYLLGERSDFGWWYYYPVVLAVKTPLPFLALLLFGAWLCFRKQANRWVCLALAFSLGILIFSALFSRINIGVRHILPVYMGFSIVAAAGALRLLELSRTAKWARWTLGLLLLWLVATSAFSHPDYLPYFNALAGDEPEKIVVDSDLDWGQDMKRLSKRLQEAGARQVTFNPFILAYLEAVHGFPPIQPMDPETPSPGWNAVSLTELKTARLGLNKEHPEVQLWPEHIKPTERIGKGVLLWYFPPNGAR